MLNIPKDLPIYSVIGDILSILDKQQNLVLQAEPGAGKSTIVPLEIMRSLKCQEKEKPKKVIMLEPRRMAAKSLATYMAQILGETVGVSVGYRVKNDVRVSSETILEIVTEGIFNRIIQNDPELSDIAVVIFDEFHERSLNTDMAFILAKEVQDSLREDLRLVVMSATLDANCVADYLGNAATIECPGRAFPVDVSYLTPQKNSQGSTKAVLTGEVNRALTKLIPESEGDILVFLPGIGEINRCLESAKQLWGNDYEFLPLHGSLNLAQQSKVLLKNEQKKKVVFTTNIAETSLTIDGVTAVIDSGLERTLQFEPNSGMTRMLTRKISQASSIQRTGRAGRLQKGVCIRLWSEAEQQRLVAFQQEEILQADLSELVLSMAHWGTPDFEDISWLTAPPKAHFESAVSLLQTLGLLDDKKRVTAIGKRAVTLPISPRLARMLLAASTKLQLAIASDMAALLSERDLLIRPDSADVMLRLDYLNRRGSFTDSNVRKHSLSQVRESSKQLQSLMGNVNNELSSLPENLEDEMDIAASLMLFAYPDRLAKRRGEKSNRYVLANGKGVILDEEDPLREHEWLVINHCDLRAKEGRVFGAVVIAKHTLKTVMSDSLFEMQEERFDEKTKRFNARRGLFYQKLEVERLGETIPSKEYVQSICHKLLIKSPKTVLNWSKKLDIWTKRVNWLSTVNNAFSPYAESFVFNQADQWLLPYAGDVTCLDDLKKIDVLPLLQAHLPWELKAELDTQAPEAYTTPSGKVVAVDYDQAQGPTVSVVLQEMFGETESPQIAGKVNLRFELLSPAKRPIQITSDLAGFWRTSYFDVAKDMRAKYPKHRWPDEPLKEKPGRSNKGR